LTLSGTTTANTITSASGSALSLQSNGGTTAITVDTSQNVGIGTSSPSTPVTVATTGNFSGNGVRVVAKAAPTGYFTEVKIQNDGTVGGVVDAGGSSNNYLSLQVQSTERMRVLSTGNILCLSGGNTSATGTGISFPATQSASSDANTLDDYEEGTFTPTFTNLGGSAIKSGAYVKVGRMVYVNIFFQNMACTGSNGVTIGGLPFARSTSATSDGDSLNAYELYNVTNPSGNLQWLWSVGNGTSVNPFAYNGSTGSSFNTSNFSSSSATLGISGWYQTAT
jgi:hypothetical protein